MAKKFLFYPYELKIIKEKHKDFPNIKHLFDYLNSKRYIPIPNIGILRNLCRNLGVMSQTEKKVCQTEIKEGRHLSEATKKKISDAKKGVPSKLKGRSLSQETKDKLSATRKERIATGQIKKPSIPSSDEIRKKAWATRKKNKK